MFFHRIVLSLLMFVCTNLIAQYSLNGTVHAEEDNAELAFATIQLLTLDTTQIVSYTTTTESGTYQLEIATKGSYMLKVTYIGYSPFLETIAIESDHVYKNIILKKDTEALDEVVLKFEPKVMKINNDTITYNLKKLATGDEKTLANIIEKLPGVKLNTSGLITVNGKLVKKLLIDGEELFKNQHRTTTESVTAQMIDGIRYLDKYQDFGNIQGFDNKQTNALDVSIKEEYKNTITGDFQVQGGHESKYLGKTNLYRFGGRFKFGFIGNWNNLGKQSITAYEYDELRGIGFDEVDKNGFKIDDVEDNSPKFLDPTADVAERINLFGALSIIYKPSSVTKFSLLNLASVSRQKQFLFNTRRFFELPDANQMEQKAVQSDFFLNTSILEFGYQPTATSFLEYVANFNPQNANEDFEITNSTSSQITSINKAQDNEQYTLDQKLTYLTKISSKTLLKGTALLVLDNTIDQLDILSSTPAFVLEDFNTLQQTQTRKRTLYGYQLQTVSKFKKEILRFEQGTIFSTTDFENRVANRQDFFNNFISRRLDSYLNASYEGKLSKRLRYTGVLGYKYFVLERFGDSFDNLLLVPSLKMDYRISASKSLNFDYSYDIAFPTDAQVHPNRLVENYFSMKLPSQVISNQLFPRHTLELFYSNFKINTGSTFSTFVNYNFAPTFLTYDNSVSENGVTTSTNIIGKNQNQLNIGLRFDKHFRNKLGVFSNFNWFYSEEKNSISGLVNQAKTSMVKNKGGIYSRFRKGVNFNLGLDLELTGYTSSLLEITTKAMVAKPYLIFNGNFSKEQVQWSIGGAYANYKTDLNETEILNIYPKVTYAINDNFEISLEGNNIFNIDNAQISQNFNTINYSESIIINTLEGYIVLGLYYRL